MSKPLWISHRGLKHKAVENTFEAFSAAVAAGFTALETDLRLSRDGHIVLCHDPDLKRLAGDSRCIADLTRSELEAVRLDKQARLMFLEQFLEAFPQCQWTFDIKPEGGDATLRALKTLADVKGQKEWIEAHAKFLTWNPRHDQLVGSLFPGSACYAREPECWRAGLSLLTGLYGFGGIKAGRTYALPPRLGSIELYREPLIAAVHQRGAHVIAYLPETDKDALQAVRCGVDEILTNGLIVGG